LGNEKIARLDVDQRDPEVAAILGDLVGQGGDGLFERGRGRGDRRREIARGCGRNGDRRNR